MLIFEHRTLKMKFFWCHEIFSEILILKMDVKINSRIIMKNNAADPEIGFLTKSILKPYGRAWELSNHRVPTSILRMYDYQERQQSTILRLEKCLSERL